MDVEITFEKNPQPKTKPKDGEYGFGKYFSDHMFITDYTTASGWHSSRVVPYQPLTLDPGASVLHYGQAIFEGLKAFRGDDGKIRMFRPEMNWKRMKASADRLCMKVPTLEVFMAGLMHLVRSDASWIPSKPGTALYLRPTLLGTEAFLGVRPSEAYLYYVIASPVGGYYGENIGAVKIWVEPEFSRAAPGGIGAAKAGGNYASSLLAATEARKRGYAQVLWLDACEKRYVEEVGTMNVFFLINDKLITPPLSGTILPGVMRDSVIQLMDSLGMPVEQRRITLDEVIAAHASGELKEVFGTGTAASISPVGQLGFADKVISIGDGSPGPLASELYQILNDLQYGRRADDMGWIMEVGPN